MIGLPPDLEGFAAVIKAMATGEAEREEEPVYPKAGRFLAEIMTRPENLATAGIAAIHSGYCSTDPTTGETCVGLSPNAMVAALRERTAKLPEDGEQEIERALTCSALLLSNLATAMTVRAMETDDLAMLEAFGRLALRAQDQQRKTLATLANVRQPKRVAFVRQLNQAVNQQVNNHDGNSSVVAKAETSPALSAIKLLEALISERLDARTPATALANDAGLAAVGALHRPQDPGRQGAQQPERDQAWDARRARA